MAKFRSRQSIEAAQFLGGVETGGYTIPGGACYCSDGDDPDELVHRFHLHVCYGLGYVVLETGDWIVQGSEVPFIMKDEEFRREYEVWPCDPGAPAEPSFTIWARDRFAQRIIRRWVEEAAIAGVSHDKIARAEQRLDEIVAFQSDHPERVKIPD